MDCKKGVNFSWQKFFDTYENTGLMVMSELQFSFAVKELILQPEEIEIGKSIFIRSETVAVVCDRMNTTTETVNDVIHIILQNLQKQLTKKGLKLYSYIVRKKEESEVNKLEKILLEAGSTTS